MANQNVKELANCIYGQHSLVALDKLLPIGERTLMLGVLREIDSMNSKCWPYKKIHAKALREVNKIENANGTYTNRYEWLAVYESICSELANKLD